MTPQEIEQVNAYIAQMQMQLGAQHAQQMQLQKAQIMQGYEASLAVDQKARRIAQQAELKMGEAVHQIWNLSIDRPTLTPAEFAVCVRQIINYYCPDYDIPF